jgi:hypothetical protein
MVRDGKELGQFLQATILWYSDDGERLYYLARHREEHLLYRNQELLARFPIEAPGDATPPIVISPNGESYAYISSTGNGEMLVVNGRPKGPFGIIARDTVVFSPNGKSYALVALMGGEFAVWNGKVLRLPAPEVSHLMFSPDSRSFAFVARFPDGQTVVVDGSQRKTYAEVYALRFAKNPPVLIYRAVNKNGEEIDVINDEEHSARGKAISSPSRHGLVAPPGFVVCPGRDVIGIPRGNVSRPRLYHESDLGFSPDGISVLCKAFDIRKAKEFYLLNDEAQDAHDYVSSPAFSADGEVFAYKAVDRKEQFIVANRVKRPAYAQVDRPVFSPYGHILAYRANKGGKQLYPQSARKSVQGGRWLVVVNGKEGPPFDYVWDPFFSPALKRVAYYALRGRSLLLVVEEIDE